ncbi:hypothetical protein ACTIVE_6550 [Actinomadura verrucosospora]|uniref:Uncharacterized protein n=1 Tax=Actinomadura verrucosospora TaxID=46165 RepID=A0A7D3VX50_ACTVE|nr:hypothetical protein ACTIVE_6550 [Actinomadura verrucosospora]
MPVQIIRTFRHCVHQSFRGLGKGSAAPPESVQRDQRAGNRQRGFSGRVPGFREYRRKMAAEREGHAPGRPAAPRRGVPGGQLGNCGCWARCTDRAPAAGRPAAPGRGPGDGTDHHEHPEALKPHKSDYGRRSPSIHANGITGAFRRTRDVPCYPL